MERERGKTETRSSRCLVLDSGSPIFVPLLGVIWKDQEHPKAVTQTDGTGRENPALGFDQKMQTSSFDIRTEAPAQSCEASRGRVAGRPWP